MWLCCLPTLLSRAAPRHVRLVSSAAATAAAQKEQRTQKAAALEAALKEINTKYGKGTIQRLGDSPLLIERIPSGCLALDTALGGGWPRGRIVEVYGPEASGKTTLALHAIAECQKAGGNAVFVDAEHALNQVYAQALGIDLRQLAVFQPESGEQALQVTDELVRSGGADLIAIDSVAALVPRAEMQGDVGALAVGAQARLMSQALRKLAGNAARMGCTIIFLNQIRYKVGVLYGSPETTSGGNALKFYASARVDVRRKETVGSGDDSSGIRVRAKVVKNKTAPPYRVAEFTIMFDRGIDTVGSLVEAAEAARLLTRRGSWYYEEGTGQRLGQGKDKVTLAVSGDPALRERLEEGVRLMLAQGKVVEVVDKDGDEDEEGVEEGDAVSGVEEEFVMATAKA